MTTTSTDALDPGNVILGLFSVAGLLPRRLGYEPAPLVLSEHIYVQRVVFIQGIIDRLVKDFGLVLRGLVLCHLPGVSGTVCSGGPAGFRGRGCRGEEVL